MHICSSCFRKGDVTQPIQDDETDSSRVQNKSNKGNRQTRFYCCRRVPLHNGDGGKRHGMCDFVKSGLASEPSVELAAEAEENQKFGVAKVINPKVPFIEDLPEELYLGRSIEIQGTLSPNANRFSINLSTGRSDDADLALHFNPRFDRHVIIRNHRIKNKWGVEEIASLQPFPFKVGRNFSVLIFVADEQFLIAVNKIHFCAFTFRIPVFKVKSLIVLGDLVLSLVQHYDRTHYPPKIFKRTPFILLPRFLKNENNNCKFRRKTKTITTGSKIDIYGRVKILPRAFYVNLQKGITIWPHPIIPFHMNYRLHQPGTHKREREVVFNSWSDGLWGKEDILSLCPFLPATEFHVTIVCKANAYVVFVNDKFFFSFAKRFETDVDSVIIYGDVVVSKVVLH